MEHLPPVSSPYEPVLVPYIAGEEYDGLDFADYPTRKGFDIDSLLKGDFKKKSSDEIAAFLQTWLYFGLVHEIFKVKLEPYLIRKDAQGKEWITTGKLPSIFKLARPLIEKEKLSAEYTPDYVQKRNERITNAMKLSLHMWEGFQKLGQKNPIPPEVGLAIQILAITLQVGLTAILGGKAGEEGYLDVPWERDDRHWRLSRNEWLEKRMILQGWCPVILEQTRQSFSIVGVYYCSLLGLPGRKLNHKKCKKNEQDCDAMKNFKTEHGTHVVEGCTCEYLIVDSSKLGAIIAKDEIPVLRLSQEDGKLVLEVVASGSEEGLEYTAMSHVWSDGWGNPEQNSLRQCRVDKIVDWISKSYEMPDFDIALEPGIGGKHFRATKHDERVFFWMDTLCVPREPIDIYEKAIIQMREVYSRAERVLVLDSSLLPYTSKATYEELNMRIRCSRWIRRLWTVQEAVLARCLIFQFKDGAYLNSTSSLAWCEMMNDLRVNYFNTVGYDSRFLFDVYDVTSGLKRVRYIWGMLLTRRVVTVKADEPICGGILMNFDMEKLMTVAAKERMREFWKMHGDQMPLAILFVPGERMDYEGFSWGPSSLLSCQFAGPDFHHTGKVTNDWLRMRLDAYTTFKFSTLTELKESIIPILLGANKYFIKKSPVKSNPSWDGLDLHKKAELAVIIEHRTVQEGGRWVIRGGASRAALVEVIKVEVVKEEVIEGGSVNREVIKREDGVDYGRYLRMVSLIQEGSSIHRVPNPAWTEGEIEEGNKTPCMAEWVAEEREWCLV